MKSLIGFVFMVISSLIMDFGIIKTSLVEKVYYENPFLANLKDIRPASAFFLHSTQKKEYFFLLSSGFYFLEREFNNIEENKIRRKRKPCFFL